MIGRVNNKKRPQSIIFLVVATTVTSFTLLTALYGISRSLQPGFSEQRGQLSSDSRNQPSDSVASYEQRLPKSFIALKKESLDFDGDGTQELAILGQDYSDVKPGGNGDEIAAYEVFVLRQNARTREWEIAYQNEADAGLDNDGFRNKVIGKETFRTVSLTRDGDAVAFITFAPSASVVCNDSVDVIYDMSGRFQQMHLQKQFPLCLESFRQPVLGTLELVFNVFKLKVDGTLLDASCCPTGGKETHTYRFDGSSFQLVS